LGLYALGNLRKMDFSSKKNAICGLIDKFLF